MKNLVRSRTPLVLPSRYFTLLVVLMLMALPIIADAQNADVGHSVQPSSRVRLTGTLEPITGTRIPALPQMRVWVGGEPWVMRVCQVEPLIPAYPAVEELRKVTGLGLRLVTDRAALAALRQAAKQGRPVEIEGQLRVRARRLRVDTVHATEIAAGHCPARGIG